LHQLADLGWRASAAATLALAVLGLAASALPRFDRDLSPPTGKVGAFAGLAMFRRPAVRRLLVLQLLGGAALTLPFGLEAILLVDAGFSVADVGLISVVLSAAAGIAAALAVRPVVERYGALRTYAGVCALATVAALVFAGGFARGPSPGFAVELSIALGVISYADFAATRALLLRLCDPDRAASELATFLSVEACAALVFAASGAMLMQAAGPSAVFLTAAALAASGAALSLAAARPGAPLASVAQPAHA